MRVYAYLRASTKDQDANRARQALQAFAASKRLTIAAWFVENESGATLARPELFRLLDVAQPGDMLLVEQVDRISRLNAADWATLKAKILGNRLRIVALDLPTSHALALQNDDQFTSRVLEAVNGLLLDLLAATARKDFEDRRRRQAEGIAKAKANGKFTGGKVNEDRHRSIEALLRSGQSYSQIQRTLGCARGTIASVSRRMKKANGPPEENAG